MAMSRLRSACLAAIVFQSAYAQVSVSSDLLTNATKAFSLAQIVPQVIPAFSPLGLVNISYVDDKAGKELVIDAPGPRLTKQQTTSEPEYWMALNLTLPSTTNSTASNSTSTNSTTPATNTTTPAAGGTYVLALLDADAPTSQGTRTTAVHYLAGGFTVNSGTGFLSTGATPVQGYSAPDPPSDPHRFVLLVYNQSPGFEANATKLVNSSTVDNINWASFTETVNLGSPVAGNFFLVGAYGVVTPSKTSSRVLPTDLSAATPLVGAAGREGVVVEAMVAFSMATVIFLLFV